MAGHPSARRHPSRPHLVLPVPVDPAGCRGPTPGQARGPHWRRTSPGHYVPSSVDGADPEQRVLETAGLMHALGAVTGWAALRWLGAEWFGGRQSDGSALPVPVCTGWHDMRSPPSVRHSRERLRKDEVRVVDRVPVTSPLRSVFFEMRHAVSVRDAVVALDMAAQADLVSVAEATAYAPELATWVGIPQAREAIALADENAWSPQESRLRLAWCLDAGLPPPLTNQPVFDRAGRHVATPDLLDVEAGLAVEYDGQVHLQAGQRVRDVVRERGVRGVGLETVTVLGPDLWDRRELAEHLLGARSRARFEPVADRRWTTQRPVGWPDRSTVAERRAAARGARRPAR